MKGDLVNEELAINIFKSSDNSYIQYITTVFDSKIEPNEQQINLTNKFISLRYMINKKFSIWHINVQDQQNNYFLPIDN